MENNSLNILNMDRSERLPSLGISEAEIINENYYCSICKNRVMKKNIDRHIKSKKHIGNVAKFEEEIKKEALILTEKALDFDDRYINSDVLSLYRMYV